MESIVTAPVTAFFKNPVFWLIVFAVIAIIGYSLYHNYTNPVNAVNDDKAPDQTDAKPGTSKASVGFSSTTATGVTAAQALPTAFRPYNTLEFNPVV